MGGKSPRVRKGCREPQAESGNVWLPPMNHNSVKHKHKHNPRVALRLGRGPARFTLGHMDFAEAGRRQGRLRKHTGRCDKQSIKRVYAQHRWP